MLEVLRFDSLRFGLQVTHTSPPPFVGVGLSCVAGLMTGHLTMALPACQAPSLREQPVGGSLSCCLSRHVKGTPVEPRDWWGWVKTKATAPGWGGSPEAPLDLRCANRRSSPFAATLLQVKSTLG